MTEQTVRAQRTACDPALVRSDRRVHAAGIILVLGLVAVSLGLGLLFLRRGPVEWHRMGGLLLVGTVGLAAANFCHAALTRSVRDALLLFGLAFGLSLAAEYAGVRWNAAFGFRYRYHPGIRPQLLGVVPLFIPVGWFALGYLPLVFLTGLFRHTRSAWRLAVKAAFCALCLVAQDLMIEPLAVSAGAWTWVPSGRYFGAPVVNFASWFLVGLAIHGAYLALGGERHVREGPDVRLLDTTHVALSVVYVAVGLAAVTLRTHSALPALLTLLGMGPYWAYWLSRRGGRGHLWRPDPVGRGKASPRPRSSSSPERGRATWPRGAAGRR